MVAKVARIKRIAKSNDAPIAGVVVTITEDRLNTHAGVLYRDVNDRVLMLHLAWHHKLRNDRFDDSYLCIDPELEDEDAEALAGHCRLVAEHRPTLAFAIHYNPVATWSLSTGKLRLVKEGKGLNCSTFVLLLFAYAGQSLVNRNGWPARKDDIGWHKYLVRMLKDDGADEKHWKGVAKDIGCARVRPEEVAGACLQSDRPAKFAQCAPNGRLVLQALERHTGRKARVKW